MSVAGELSASAPKDAAYTIPEAPQQQCTDNADADAGGDARNATPAAATTGPLGMTAVPSAGDSDIAGLDKQCLGDAPEAPCSAPTSLAPTNADKREDVRHKSTGRQSMFSGPVVYVRVPVGERYPPPEYYRNEPPYRDNWGGGGGTWGGSGGGGGGGRANQLRLLDDGEWEDAGPFSEATVRRAFIRKVYTVLSLQLAFTVGIIALFIFEPNVKKFVLTHQFIRSIAWVVFIVIYVTLVCCGDIRRRHPCNVILLSIFTLAFSYFLGVIAAFFGAYIVFMAVAMTTVIVLLVTLVATFSKVDITGCAALLCVLSMAVIVFGIGVVVMFLVSREKNLLMLAIFAGVTCVLFSLYLMFDTQLIMGGRYLQLSPDEYIYAALQLYVDIGYILWMLIMMLACCFSD